MVIIAEAGGMVVGGKESCLNGVQPSPGDILMNKQYAAVRNIASNEKEDCKAIQKRILKELYECKSSLNHNRRRF